MLIEILVGIFIMGLIAGPLTMAFVTFLRSGPAVRGEIDRSSDARRIGWAWTRDAQNVEPGGVNSDSGCGRAILAAPEVNLVSFRWNTSSDAAARGELPVTSSWVAVGVGSDLQLVRRQCSGETLVSEDVLARHVGIDGTPITSTIHGPNPLSPTDFCPVQDLGGGNYLANSCTIVIEGSFKYDLVVTRRVSDRTGGVNVLPPPAPTITGASGRNTYLTVAWTPPPLASGQPPISGYRVFVYTDPNGSPVGSAEVDGQSTSADIDGLANGTPYWVRVQAQNSAQWGELTAPFGAITPNPTTPDAGSVVSVEPLNGQVSVAWTAPLNNGGLAITEWHIYAKPSSGAEVGPAVITPGGSTTGVITGLTNGTTYTIVVAAVNGLGEGVRSDPSGPVVPYGPSDPATAVVAQANDSKVKVQWTPPANSNGRPIIGYTIFTYKGLNQGTQTASMYKTVAEAACAATCSFDVPVANADYYRFAIQARTDVGGGGTLEGTLSGLTGILGQQYGPLVQANQVRPSTTPAVPATPTVALGAGTNSGTYKLTATVVLPNDNGANAHSIQVEYQRAPTVNPTSWTTQSSVTQATSGSSGASKTVVIDNLPSGYLYRVRAQVANRGEWTNSGDRWSGYSGYSTSVVGPSAPGAPTSVVVSRPSGSFGMALNLSFVAPADTGGATITGYSISCTAPNGTTITRSAATAGTVSLTGSDVRDGRNYSCSVAAVNSVGTGSAGATASTAKPYGECTLKTSQTQHIKEQSGVQSNTANFWVRQRWQNFWGADQNFREAGLIRWNWTSNCSNYAAAMPADAYVASATFSAYIETTQDYDHDVVRITSNWSASTQWSNQPSYSTKLGDWTARSTGWRSLDVLTAVQQMKGNTTDYGLEVRNPTTSCYLCNGDSARYTGQTGANAPKLDMTFYSQGA